MAFSAQVGSAAFTPASRDRLANLLGSGDSALKGTAASILNREANRLMDIAARMARDELRVRPEDRRSPESRGHDHYYDSFRIITARSTGYRMEVGIKNVHPMARAVESGTRPHVIPASGNSLAFPFAGPGLGGGVGRAGTFAVTTADAPNVYPKSVQHPGAAPHRIVERSILAWRAVTPLRRR